MSKIALNSNASGTGVFTIASPNSDTDRTLTLPDASGDFVLSSGGVISDFTSTGIDDNATSTAITIDSSQKVGIGTASPDSELHISGVGNVAKIILEGGANPRGNFIACENADDLVLAADEDNLGSLSTMRFRVDGAERMRIDSSGNLLVGTTSATVSNEGFRVLKSGSAGAMQTEIFNDSGGTALAVGRGGSNGACTIWKRGSSTVGSISVTTSSTSYNTSSDYRLKENVVDLDNGIDRLKQIPVHRFNFIADPDTTVDGFIAHEVQDVVPEAITGAKDAVDDEGNPEYQGIDQSKLVPLLTAALQEAVAKIEDLESRLSALETN